MSQPVISVEGLSKRYQIGHQVRHDTLRDRIAYGARGLLRRWKHPVGGTTTQEEFWALRDVSFEIKQGEVVGIIGRNGAGKSTLLKILSRITEPTTGRASIRGRVASLLEVGTGFHPELTGRENIFLNGAILGMAHAEIRGKFDEIVAFAEVESFLDTPVKHYSSGMYVRLAFAVAAHLEPEVLIVDEVLAVGDAQFQKKCLGKMQDVATNEGRTILLVSHQMSSIQRLCDSCILLESGRISHNGSTATAIERYSRQALSKSERVNLSELRRHGSLRKCAQLRAAITCSDRGLWAIEFAADLVFQLEIEASYSLDFVQLGLGIFSATGMEIASAVNPGGPVVQGRHTYTVRYEGLRLVPGTYTFGVGLRSSEGMEDYVSDAFTFEVLPSAVSAEMRTEHFGGQFVPLTNITLSRS